MIFDESQKDSNNEIWINLYPLTQLLQKHTSEVVRDSETKEYRRKYEIEILPDKTGRSKKQQKFPWDLDFAKFLCYNCTCSTLLWRNRQTQGT